MMARGSCGRESESKAPCPPALGTEGPLKVWPCDLGRPVPDLTDIVITVLPLGKSKGLTAELRGFWWRSAHHEDPGMSPGR